MHVVNGLREQKNSGFSYSVQFVTKCSWDNSSFKQRLVPDVPCAWPSLSAHSKIITVTACMIFCTMIHKCCTNRTFDLIAMPELSPNKACQSGNTRGGTAWEHLLSANLSDSAWRLQPHSDGVCCLGARTCVRVCILQCKVWSSSSHTPIYMQKSGWTHGTDGIARGDSAHQTEGVFHLS